MILHEEFTKITVFYLYLFPDNKSDKERFTTAMEQLTIDLFSWQLSKGPWQL